MNRIHLHGQESAKLHPSEVSASLRPPRIGIVTVWFERGAAYVSRAYHSVLSKHFDVYIYARGGEKYAIGDPVWDGSRVTWGKRNWTGSIDLQHLLTWIERNRLNVILFNEQQDWTPVLSLMQSDLIVGAYVDYYTEETVPFFSLYDFLLCNTRRHLSVFKWHPNALFIPWGTDPSLFRPRERSCNTDKIVFFHSAGMGGVNLRKGTDLAVKAFHDLDSRNCRLVIHSQVPLLKFGQEIEGVVAADERIEFVQETVGAPGLYHLGDVYLYPSRLEGIGLTVPEAIASGLPVITANSRPMSEFVLENQTGRLARIASERRRSDGYYWPERSCSVQHLSEIMSGFVERRADLWRWRAAARDYALQYLDWKKNSRNLPQLLLGMSPNPDRGCLAEALHMDIADYQKRIWPYNSRRYRAWSRIKRLLRLSQ